MRWIAIFLIFTTTVHADVVSRGVRALSKAGSAELRGAVTLTGGSNVTLTQSGQDISIAATASGVADSAVATKTANYTLLDTDDIILANASSGKFTLTLPAATNTGKIYSVKKIDAKLTAVTIQPNGSDTIDGEKTIVLDIPDTTIRLADDGGNKWRIL
mgnify:CR=1 FL=1